MKKLLLAGALLMALGTVRADGPVVVSAGVSVQKPMTEIASQYRRRFPNAKLQLKFGVTGIMQQQVEKGETIDVIVTSSQKSMDELQAEGLVVSSTRAILARNRMTLIVPSKSRVAVRSFADLAKPEVKSLAIAAPQTVAAGQYARQILNNLGLWKSVRPKIVQAKDVDGAVDQVEQGRTDAAIVYRTNAIGNPRVRIVSVAPANLHTPIVYSLAVTTASKQQSEARRFASYLTSASAQKVLQRHGFGTAD
jgi:molybdate transport system substrate-binding protein